MLSWWSNIFAMLGVALIVTTFFRPDWEAGRVTGGILSCLAQSCKGWQFR